MITNGIPNKNRRAAKNKRINCLITKGPEKGEKIMVRYDVYEEKVRGLYKTLEEAGYSL